MSRPAYRLSTSMPQLKHHFRGFLPVVVDVETGGFNARTDALLEVAAVILGADDEGRLVRQQTVFAQVEPFRGANIEKAALEVNGIKIDSPLRMAMNEKDALDKIFRPIRNAVSENGCSRAILVGHNAHFDLGFVNAAVERTGIKRCPFHPFSVFDTATLGGVLLGQTVLAKALAATGLGHDTREAHSAIYDAEKTADLFCLLFNSAREVRQQLLLGAAPDEAGD